MVKRLTRQAEKLLNGLEKHPNTWFTRSQVASLIGKRRLTPYDIELLDMLGEMGKLRITQEEGYSREGFRWVYGVFDEDYDENLI